MLVTKNLSFQNREASNRFFLSCVVVSAATLSLFSRIDFLKIIGGSILTGTAYCAGLFYLGYFPQITRTCVYTPLQCKKDLHVIHLKDRVVYSIISSIHIGWKLLAPFGIVIALFSQTAFSKTARLSRISFSQIAPYLQVYALALFAISQVPRLYNSLMYDQKDKIASLAGDDDAKSIYFIITDIFYLKKFELIDAFQARIGGGNGLNQRIQAIETSLGVIKEMSETLSDKECWTIYQTAYRIKKNDPSLVVIKYFRQVFFEKMIETKDKENVIASIRVYAANKKCRNKNTANELITKLKSIQGAKNNSNNNQYAKALQLYKALNLVATFTDVENWAHDIIKKACKSDEFAQIAIRKNLKNLYDISLQISLIGYFMGILIFAAGIIRMRGGSFAEAYIRRRAQAL